MSEPLTQRRVYVVDDDDSVRDSLCALLFAHRFEVVSCADARAFLACFRLEGALCAFIDLRMPEMSGIELQDRLVRRGIDVPLVILTAYGEVPLAVKAMKMGAVDFIEKPASEERLLKAIEAAEGRLSKRPPSAVSDGVVSGRLAKLTGREKEVLDHLVLGMTNKHIAEALGISQRTIEIHRSRIREKLEARGLSDLIRMTR